MRRICASLLVVLAAACGDDGGGGGGQDAGIDGPTPAYTPWTMVVLPDTQVYMDQHPEIWMAQARWIHDHAAEHNVKLVAHVGDITEWNAPVEWARARAGFDEIEAVATLAPVTGNHDYDVTMERTSRLTEYWPVDAFFARPTAGGLYDEGTTENHYQTLDVNGQRWLVLGLEWGPRPEVLAWAGGVIDTVPADHVVIVTHAYLYNDDRRYDWERRGTAQQWNPHSYRGTAWPVVTDGEEMWQLLVSPRQVDLVLCGHVAVDGVGHATSFAAGGHPVHEVLQDYQGEEMGGQGYLRLFTFYGDRIEVRTYSPWLDRFDDTPGNRFELPWRFDR